MRLTGGRGRFLGDVVTLLSVQLNHTHWQMPAIVDDYNYY